LVVNGLHIKTRKKTSGFFYIFFYRVTLYGQEISLDICHLCGVNIYGREIISMR
jgi:hypothetical protein